MNVFIKLVITAVSLAAGALARKALTLVWRRSTGTDPQTPGEDLQHPLRGVSVCALATVAIGTVIRVLAQRAGSKAATRSLQLHANDQ